MRQHEHFDTTAKTLSQYANVHYAYVLQLTREGILEHIRASNGLHLYKRSAVPVVQKVKAERIARRGRYPRGLRAH